MPIATSESEIKEAPAESNKRVADQFPVGLITVEPSSLRGESDGWVVIKDYPSGAVVEVDGRILTVTPSDGKPFTSTTIPGQHRLHKKKDAFDFESEQFQIFAGKQTSITVPLERSIAKIKDKPRVAGSAEKMVTPKTDGVSAVAKDTPNKDEKAPTAKTVAQVDCPNDSAKGGPAEPPKSEWRGRARISGW